MEHEWEGCNTEERLINRQEKAKPVVDEFFQWLHQIVNAGLFLSAPPHAQFYSGGHKI